MTRRRWRSRCTPSTPARRRVDLDRLQRRQCRDRAGARCGTPAGAGSARFSARASAAISGHHPAVSGIGRRLHIHIRHRGAGRCSARPVPTLKGAALFSTGCDPLGSDGRARAEYYQIPQLFPAKTDREAFLQGEAHGNARTLQSRVRSSPGKNPGEKRRSSGTRVIKAAVIVFNDSHCSMDCQVLDLSATGARLKPANNLVCPEQFTLKFRFLSA